MRVTVEFIEDFSGNKVVKEGKDRRLFLVGAVHTMNDKQAEWMEAEGYIKILPRVEPDRTPVDINITKTATEEVVN